MRLFIADLHFFHKTLLDHMDKRGFSSVDEMNEYMINQWNLKVKAADEVYILGDFSFGKPEETMEVLRRLKGKKYLIIGNHDFYIRSKKFDQSLFGFTEYYKELKQDGKRLILCHYPMTSYRDQYKLNKKGEPISYMLYGHVHDSHDERLVNQFINITRETKVTYEDGETINIPSNMINCFCMYSDYKPLSLEEWIENDRIRRGRLNGEK